MKGQSPFTHVLFSIASQFEKGFGGWWRNVAFGGIVEHDVF
jgi:hypothetical protein